MNLEEERMKKVTAFLEAVAKLDLTVRRQVDFSIRFKEGISPVLILVPPIYNRITHDDFKQLIAASEENGLKFTFELGVFKLI